MERSSYTSVKALKAKATRNQQGKEQSSAGPLRVPVPHPDGRRDAGREVMSVLSQADLSLWYQRLAQPGFGVHGEGFRGCTTLKVSDTAVRPVVGHYRPMLTFAGPRRGESSLTA